MLKAVNNLLLNEILPLAPSAKVGETEKEFASDEFLKILEERAKKNGK